MPPRNPDQETRILSKCKCCALALLHQSPYFIEAFLFCLFLSFVLVGLTCRLTLPQLETFSVGSNASTTQHTAYDRITNSSSMASAYKQCESFMGDRPEDSVLLFLLSIAAFCTYPIVFEAVISLIAESCRCLCDRYSIQPMSVAKKTSSRVVVAGTYNLPTKNNGDVAIARSCQSRWLRKNKNSITQHVLGKKLYYITRLVLIAYCNSTRFYYSNLITFPNTKR
jgi:hypothetical protein